MSNKNNATVESEMTYSEAVDVLKKSKKKKITSIIIDSILDVALVAGTIYCVKNEKYVEAGVGASLLVGSSVITAKNAKDLKEISETLNLANEQTADNESSNDSTN